MPAKHYPLENESPNRLEISMDLFYKFTIKFDGKIVAQAVPIHRLQLGEAFTLPDESILKLKYMMPQAGITSLESLVVIRNEKTLPGSAPISAQVQDELARLITVGLPSANPQESTSLRSPSVKQYTFESEDSIVHRIEASWKIAPYRYLITLDGKMFLAFDTENVTSRLPEGIKLNMPDGSIFEFINRMPTKLEHLQILRNGKPIRGSAGGTAPSIAGNKQNFRQISFKPNITSEQIQQALILSDVKDSSQFNVDAIEREKVEARKKTKQLLILGILFSLFAIVFGFLVYPLAICFGIIGLIVFPIVAAQQNKHINSPLNTSSPIEVIKEFYSDVMIYGANKNSDIKLASMPERTYQLVAPTSKDRQGCESVSSFKSSWENAYKKIHEYLIPYPSVIEKSQSLSFITTNYIIVYKTDDAFDIEYSGIVGIAEPLQYKIKPKYLATCHFKFQNIAVKIAGKWYLMAGEPGEPAFGNVELVVGQ